MTETTADTTVSEHALLAGIKGMSIPQRYQLTQLLQEKLPVIVEISKGTFLNTNKSFTIRAPHPFTAPQPPLQPYEEYVCDVHKCVLKKMEDNCWSCPKCHEVYYAAQKKLQQEAQRQRDQEQRQRDAEKALREAEKEADCKRKAEARDQRKAAKREEWEKVFAFKKQMEAQENPQPTP